MLWAGDTKRMGLFIMAGLAVVAVVPNLGCDECKYDVDELPIPKCDPVPSGSEGCVGLPGEPPRSDANVYPVNCRVLAAWYGKCGYSTFFCERDRTDRSKFKWFTDL